MVTLLSGKVAYCKVSQYNDVIYFAHKDLAKCVAVVDEETKQ